MFFFFYSMPVALPPVPHCQTPLPALPHDPPILNDISNVVDYNQNLRVSRRQGGLGRTCAFSFPVTDDLWLISRVTSIDVVATKNLNDIARGAIYESAIIAARAGGGMYSTTPMLI